MGDTEPMRLLSSLARYVEAKTQEQVILYMNMHTAAPYRDAGPAHDAAAEASVDFLAALKCAIADGASRP